MARFDVNPLLSAIRAEIDKKGLRPLSRELDIPLGILRRISDGEELNFTLKNIEMLADRFDFSFRADIEHVILPPYPDHKVKVENANPSAPILDRFAFDMDLPARGYAKCSLAGHLQTEKEYHEPPAPVGIREVDAASFYVVAKGTSMIPEGIQEGDYCLVSPNTPLAPGARVWLKDDRNAACIKRLVGESDTTYDLRGWNLPQLGRQQNHYIEWFKTDIVEQGSILAVYRGRPDAAKPPPLVPDPKPPVPLPREIADLLGMSEGASVAAAVKVIERLGNANKPAGAVSCDDITAFLEARIDSLRDDMTAFLEAGAKPPHD